VIGVVGASARAAVHSLARAGFSAWSIDLFADRDLKRVAECAVCPSERYPDAIPELAKQFPPGPVLYTGGLENHLHILRELTSTRELWGNPADVVERVRDPFTLFPLLANAGFTVPRLVACGEPCPREGRWLRKPLRSGGGLGIRFARAGEPASPHHYFQEFIDGLSMSVVFCGTTLLGETEQLIGERWLHAKGFTYCGNIGPGDGVAFPAFPLPLRGVWGLDFVLRNKQAFVVEVNPRYTAAVEVLEFARGIAALREEPNPLVGKAIYYAPHTLRFPQSGPWDADLVGDFDPWRLPGFADIPDAGSTIETGHPVFTFFATGSTPAEVRKRLQSRASELNALFQGCNP
jgi:predicted ATP-grasp superfamily ATP-dependent carboligase